MTIVSKVRADREARELQRLNAVIDGLWMLDTAEVGSAFKEHFTPYRPENQEVWGRLLGFCAVAGNLIMKAEEVLLGFDSAMVAVYTHQLTIEAVRWYDDLIAEIAPVEVPQHVQVALIAGATYQLALRKADKPHVELDFVVQHVWELCFDQVKRGVAARMES